MTYKYRLIVNGQEVGELYNSVEAAGLKLCRMLRQAMKTDATATFTVSKEPAEPPTES